MGPKDKKAKKPKLTKAEKEKLKKEEAEQKAKEEEEARLLAEQAEIERLEQERIEAEERRLLEERERVRHQAEIDELNKELEENKQYLTHLKKTLCQKNKWNRYMLCDGRPDPTCKKEVNSFINLTWEDTRELKLANVLNNCELVLKLIDELDEHIEEAREELTEHIGKTGGGVSETEIVVNIHGYQLEENNEEIVKENNEKNAIETIKTTIEAYKESKDALCDLINYRLDVATLAVLKSPGDNIDPDDSNIQCCQQTDNLKICIWGNSAKNPRVKQVAFGKDSFTMELPKQMAVLEISVRVLYMNFDPLSCKSPLFHMKPPKKEEGVIPYIDIEVQQSSSDNLSVNEGGLKVNNDLKATPSTAISAKNVLSTKDVSRNKSRSGTPLSRSNSAKGGSKIQCSVEDSASKQQVADTIEPPPPPPVDEDDIDEDIVDLRLFSPMGSLVYVEFLQLPPQPKEVKGWIMQQVSNGGLRKLCYGLEEQQPDSSTSMKSVTAINTTSIHSPNSANGLLAYNSPILLSLRVDEKVVFHEDPQIARWDDTTQNWKLDGITETKFEKESEVLSFRTIHFGVFAVIQDKYLSLPFQSWHLRPKALNECILNLVSATVEVDIVVKEGLCCVQFESEIKQAAHIVGKWMKPLQLIEALRSVGLNFFPHEDGHKYVKVYPKVDAVVTPIYQYMSLLASCFSFMMSKWNTECADEKVVVQSAEWLHREIPTQASHRLYYSTTRICYPLNMDEYADEFSKDVLPNSHMHPDLYHMLREGTSSAAKQRLADTSVVFIHCIHQLLSATNLLVYC